MKSIRLSMDKEEIEFLVFYFENPQLTIMENDIRKQNLLRKLKKKQIDLGE